MTDGNTGFHVAPITEDEMSKVQAILKRAIDATMAFSQIQADVTMLRDTVAGLQADTERLRSQNNALDEALNYSRAERDRQAAKLAETETELRNAVVDRDKSQNEQDKLYQDLTHTRADLDRVAKAKDEAEFKVLELEEKLSTANARIAQATKHISDMASLFRPDEPEPNPQHQPDPMPTHWPEPTPKPTDPAPQQEAHPVQAAGEYKDDGGNSYYTSYYNCYWNSDNRYHTHPEPTKTDGEDLHF